MVVHVHKNRIVAGDVAVPYVHLTNSTLSTIGAYYSFMGVTIFGNSYHGGHKLVPRVHTVRKF